MNRRGFLFAVSVCALARANEAFAQAGEDAVTFVRNFYTREIDRYNAKERIGDTEFLSVFTPATQKIWVAARDNKNPPPVLAGPLTHAFFGPGVLPGRDVKLVKTAVAGGGARLLAVAVDITVEGNPRKLYAYVVRDGSTWRFDDIDYGQRESFVSYHKRRAGM